MFARQNGVFVFAAYAIVLLLLGIFARLAFFYYNANRVAVVPDPNAPSPSRPVVRQVNSPIHYDYAAVAAANERLSELRASLDRATEQLHEKSKLLNQRNSECQALEEKLDESVAFALELLAQEPGADRDEQTRDVKALLEKDLAALRKQLDNSRVMSNEHTKQIESLRVELMEADQQTETLREQATQEIGALLDERFAIEAVAADIMLQLGEDGVPSLVDLLRHEQPAVRLWSATVLGKLGLAATTAIEPLNLLEQDPDPRVASAAARSIKLIEP